MSRIFLTCFSCLILLMFSKCNESAIREETARLNVGDSLYDTPRGKIRFSHNLPDSAARKILYHELEYTTGIQAVIWAEPAVNNLLFLKAMLKAGVPNLGAMIYDKRMHPGQETLTPNQSVVYLYDLIDLKTTGPVVHIVPEGPINAGFFDMWMRPVYDFGVVGPNKGKGDKILIIPPGWKGKIPTGYQVAYPKTFQVFTITRIPVNSEMSEEEATSILEKIKTYPLSELANPKGKVFVLMGDPAKGGKEFRMNRPHGIAYWEMVHEIIDEETVEDRDRAMLGFLQVLGIEKGKPFAPAADLKEALIEAEQVGKLIMVNEAFSPRYRPDTLKRELYEKSNWENIQLASMSQEEKNRTSIIYRMIGFYQANGAQFIWEPRDFPPGFGQKYAAVYQDSKNQWFFGEMNYKMHIPGPVPVKEFYSVAIYDVDTRALIEAPQHIAEINPNVQKLQTNPDGSVDLYFGPSSPEGKESNWIQTVPGRAWFAYFRWYGPTEPYYDKSWKLPAVEKIQ